jgi:ferredoxin
LDLIDPLLQVDAVINLPKLKTHNLTVLTMSVKNLFGLVPGSLKIGYHSKLVDRELFCEGLLDLMLFVQPVLTVMDAVVGMEGEGPTGGEPRQIGAIVSGRDPLAIDTLGALLVGVDPLTVTTTRLAAARGLTTGNIQDITVVGDTLDSLQVHDFCQGLDAPLDPGLIPGPLRFLVRLATPPTVNDQPDTRGARAFRSLAQGWIWKQLVARPRATEQCIACGFCVKHCPVNAIEIVNGRARMDGSVCIRCYCCHELCPHDAIDLYKPLLGRLVSSK